MSWTAAEKPEDFTCKDNSVEYTGPPPNQSTIFNAIFSEQAQEGETYFEFTVEKGDSVSVGLTTKDLFKSGYKLRAACYNGNLTNASGAKRTHFGPRTTAGTVIGILSQLKGDNVKLTFYHNGACLGLGFDVPAPEGKLQPVVSLRTPGDKVSVVSKPPPTQRTREETAGPFPEGSWRLKSFAGEDIDFEVDVTFQPQPNAMGMIAKVINTLRTSVEPLGGDEYKPSGRVVSTMMAGPEHQMNFETRLTELMESVKTIAKEGSEGCVITSTNGVVANLCAHSLVIEPVTEDIFKA